MPYLWGYVAAFVLIMIAAIIALISREGAHTLPTVSQNQSTTQAQTVNIHLPNDSRQLQPSWNQRKQWLEATDGGRIGPAKEPPNLRPQTPEPMESVQLDVLDTWSTRAEERIPKANKALALLVPIRNEPKGVGDNVGIATNIRARIVWSVGGKEVCTAYPAAWVNEHANTVKIGAEAKRLIVALESEGGVWRVPTNQRGYGDHTKQAMRLDALPREDATMEVQLVTERTSTIETVARFVYEWQWKEYGPELILISVG